MKEMMDQDKINYDARMRLDKWLWAARFFKTRTLAAQAIQKNQVRVNQQSVKPSKEVKVQDVLEIKVQHGLWQCVILGLSDRRGPASMAQTLFQETEQGRMQRLAELDKRLFFEEPAARLHGRPTKRNRRKMMQMSGPSSSRT